MIAVLDKLCRVAGCSRTEVYAHHHFRARRLRPTAKFMQSDKIGLKLPPREIKPHGALRSDAVPPVIPREKIPARIADFGYTQFSDSFRHILPKAVFVRKRMVRLINSAINRPAHVLDKTAPDVLFDRPDDKLLVDNNFVLHWSSLFFKFLLIIQYIPLIINAIISSCS